MKRIDVPAIEKAMRDILVAIGEDPEREGLVETPQRIARMYQEIFSGIHKDPADSVKFFYAEDHREMVIAKGIPFYSMCEHHVLPFFGIANIAYIPQDKITGISKLARILDTFSRRLQVQERLTTQIADFIDKSFAPQGVMVVIHAEHLCMSMRGIQRPGTQIVTSAVRGVFDHDPSTRNEALSLFKW